MLIDTGRTITWTRASRGHVPEDMDRLAASAGVDQGRQAKVEWSSQRSGKGLLYIPRGSTRSSQPTDPTWWAREATDEKPVQAATSFGRQRAGPSPVT